MSRMTHPPLSTVHLPTQQAGRAAVELMLRLLGGHDGRHRDPGAEAATGPAHGPWLHRDRPTGAVLTCPTPVARSSSREDAKEETPCARVDAISRLAAARRCPGLLTACGAPASENDRGPPAGTSRRSRSKAVTLNILDVAGNQRLTEGMVDEFVEKNPDVSSRSPEDRRRPTSRATSSRRWTAEPVHRRRLHRQRRAGGRHQQDLWIRGADDYGDRVSNQENYLEPAAKMQELARATAS